jgi:hypothetical protein
MTVSGRFVKFNAIPRARLCSTVRFCYLRDTMSLTHDNLPAAIEDLSSRIIAIRDSL